MVGVTSDVELAEWFGIALLQALHQPAKHSIGNGVAGWCLQQCISSSVFHKMHREGPVRFVTQN